MSDIMIKDIWKNERICEIFRFGVTGVACFAVDYALLFWLAGYMQLHYLIAAAVGFTVSTAVNFIICVYWVFDGVKHQNARSTMLFVGSSIMGLAINQIFMWAFVDKAHLHYMISKVIVTGIVMIWNYFMKRRALRGVARNLEENCEKKEM